MKVLKTPVKKAKGKAETYTHMDPVEIDRAEHWYQEGKTPHEIAGLLDRHPRTIRNHLFATKSVAKVGRPKMPERDYQKCAKALDQLQKARPGKEITVAMVKAKAKVKWGERVLREAFAAHGKPWRKLREKPLLTDRDIVERWEFSKQYSKRSGQSWLVYPHAKIDNKKFVAYLDHKGRVHASRRSVRGAYRSGGQALESHLVKPKESQKYPAKGVMVTAVVLKGRVRFFHVTEGRWNGAKACEMYTELSKAMRRTFPDLAAKPRTKWTVLEDNDPAGYKAGVAVSKKEALGINVLALPPRSPDLNILDYYVWSAISKRLRQQEALFPCNKKETMPAFIRRLRKTALGLPAAEIARAEQSMKRRLVAIKKAEGGLIEG